MDKIEILTAKNQYNYTTKQLIIDHEAKTFKVCGMDGKIAKKNSTKKAIYKRLEEVQAMGYINEEEATARTQAKNNIIYYTLTMPKGWKVDTGARTQPGGSQWINNNKSIFDKDFKACLYVFDLEQFKERMATKCRTVYKETQDPNKEQGTKGAQDGNN